MRVAVSQVTAAQTSARLLPRVERRTACVIVATADVDILDESSSGTTFPLAANVATPVIVLEPENVMVARRVTADATVSVFFWLDPAAEQLALLTECMRELVSQNQELLAELRKARR